LLILSLSLSLFDGTLVLFCVLRDLAARSYLE